MSNVLDAKERSEFRNSVLTKIRGEGNIPAVVYGPKTENKSIYLNGPQFFKTIKRVGRNGVMALDIDGKKIDVILSDYQEDPISKDIVHLDFRAVDMSQEITATVRVTLTEDAAGVKDGGVLQQPLYEISITATPVDIPSAIEVDVANLQVNETITIADIRGKYPFKINHEDDETVASILAPKQEEEISSGEKQSEQAPDNEEGRETEATEETADE